MPVIKYIGVALAMFSLSGKASFCIDKLKLWSKQFV